MAPTSILLGRGEEPCALPLSRANRHGLIAGATGTGKTVTLQSMAEGFSRAGVPVFCADIKGDLSGIAAPGTPNPKLEQRARELGVTDFAYEAAPVVFWDVFGQQGHPLRATIAEMGPVLLARMLELNEAQEGALTIAFALADDEGLLLLDLKDLRALLAHMAERTAELSAAYGHVTRPSLGAIQRRLLMLEQAGAEHFFGEPALSLDDLMLTAPDGRGAVNVLAADRLVASPRLYATFLLWLLAELFEELPEVGDLPKPKLVFFFDEAHLLFRDAPRALVEKVETVVRLIRSKGVGVYFVTQSPLDLPQSVLGQLGNRVQHALRAFTPADQKAVRAAAATFRPNPRLRTEEAITELAVGEALVSTLGADGTPSVVQRARIVPPRSRIGPLTGEERAAILAASPLAGRYDTPLDRDSAYEMLVGRATTLPAEAGPHPAGPAPVRQGSPWGTAPAAPPPAGGAPPPTARRIPLPQQPSRPSGMGGVLSDVLTGGGGRRQGAGEALVKSMARTIGTQVGRQIGGAVLRGVLGSILKR
ncbi:helicase HerA-like domain-containing protein [Crenalkalicoccus roseus]|uniref:helicase HerA-like domain-containing protein n=1 Tax=Crenalkalicoccus roseus TaxID=1485588 RepID=UPI001081346F|nr:helicase HerA-like domain-containing protein [Crenalkalicoccus roseus]